jgi:hypothetical protein
MTWHDGISLLEICLVQFEVVIFIMEVPSRLLSSGLKICGKQGTAILPFSTRIL